LQKFNDRDVEVQTLLKNLKDLVLENEMATDNESHLELI